MPGPDNNLVPHQPASADERASSSGADAANAAPLTQANMPKFDFDRIVPRRGTNNYKWDRYPKEILPMFVADMDFETPAPIVEAMERRLKHHFYGYALTPPSLIQTVQEMLQKKYSFNVEHEALIFLPCLVSALAVVSRIAAEEKQKLIIPTPCYPPFTRTPKHMNAEFIACPMAQDSSGVSVLDIDAFDRAADQGGKILFLCNPHNPTGRVYSVQELNTLGTWAEKRDITIISDEIHCELILEPGLRHTPIATLDPAFSNRTITLMSPSKTFNMPGLGISFAIIQNASLRARFDAARASIVAAPNLLGMVACEAAYKECEPWRQELLAYLLENRDLVVATLTPYEPWFKVNRPQATYLAWIDATLSGWQNPQHEILSRGKLALSDGEEFLGPSHVRLNFGCPRPLLKQGLNRLTYALDAQKS